MTLREKVQHEDPHCVDADFPGGVLKCPGDYEYLNTDIDITTDKCFGLGGCEECWNQEFKEQ